MAPSSPPSPLTVSDLSLTDLRAMVQQTSDACYAVLDACDEPRVPLKVQQLGDERAVSLYRGTAQRDYWSIAPYLVRVDETMLEWIVGNLWHDPWGFFAFAKADIGSLRKHLRKFLIVQAPEGERMYFRFYDPRVLGPFLETCTQHEMQEFFGPVERLVICERPIRTRLYLPQ